MPSACAAGACSDARGLTVLPTTPAQHLDELVLAARKLPAGTLSALASLARTMATDATTALAGPRPPKEPVRRPPLVPPGMETKG